MQIKTSMLSIDITNVALPYSYISTIFIHTVNVDCVKTKMGKFIQIDKGEALKPETVAG